MKSKKHILLVSSWYPTKNNPTHGIFNYYFAQAAALYNKVSVLHISSNSEQKTGLVFSENEEEGLTTLNVYYKKATIRIPLLFQLVVMARRAKAFKLGYEKLVAKTGIPHLVHLNVVFPAGVEVLRLSKKNGLPYVVNENWSGYCKEDGNYKGLLLKYFTRRIIKNARAVMPTSEFLKQAMLSHGLKGNYFVVPNVVNVEHFKPQYKTNKGLTRYIHISSLTDREKNVSGLIQSFTCALNVEPGIELVIVGDGPERKNFEKMAVALGCKDKIQFKGRLTGQHLVNEINAADCLVMFSHFETFCLVIIEAFACGKPVITSDAGAIKSYMKPELGIMVKKGNEKQLTDAMTMFAKHTQRYDSQFLRNYAVENYSYQKVGRQLDEIYNTVLQHKL